MKSADIIPFNRGNHLLKKAQELLANTDLFFSDPQEGVTRLLDALPYCKPMLMLKLLPLLGYAGKDRVLLPLYRLIVEPEQDEQVRISAAVQLGTAGAQSRDPSTVTMLLMDNLDYPDSSIRSCSALALGWEGNNIAVNHLMSHLMDSDRDVQAAIVTALSAIGGTNVFYQLKERLKTGALEEKRSIILNLWRFIEKVPEVATIYADQVNNIDAELKADLLTGIGMIPLSEEILDVYGRLLRENEAVLQLQILKNLSTRNPNEYFELKPILKELAKNSETEIRQMVIRLLSSQDSIR
jgi:hypothetical protein